MFDILTNISIIQKNRSNSIIRCSSSVMESSGRCLTDTALQTEPCVVQAETETRDQNSRGASKTELELKLIFLEVFELRYLQIFHMLLMLPVGK